MSSFDGGEVLLVAVIAALTVGLLTGTTTCSVKDQIWQNSAVASGHAEYFKDPNDQTQWRWKKNQ